MTGLAQKNGAVWSHLRISTSPDSSGEVARSAGEGFTSPAPSGEVARSAGEGMIGGRIGLAEADLLLGCDLVTAAEKDSIFTLDRARTRAVLNAWLQPTAQFQMDPELRLDLEAELHPIRAGVSAERLHAIDATTLALKLLGNTIGANFLLVGYALQAGGLPVTLAAVDRALAMNGQAVDFNRRALALGRLAFHDWPAVEKLLDEATPEVPVTRIPAAQTLDALVHRRAEYLAEYQDTAYAERYMRLVQRVRDAERERAKGSSGLAEAVARNYFKLLAYKDEYEVARLHSSAAFLEQIERTFEGPYELRFHLAPPLIARPDPVTGKVRKREFGPWMLPVFRLLARLKRLRGTALDPFGWLADRKLERQLVREYEQLLDEILARLDGSRHATAVALAALPESVRGYGHVKQRNLVEARKRETELLTQLRADVIAPVAA
jgi:indolepyruvate ferredoxin oxidoreductase